MKYLLTHTNLIGLWNGNTCIQLCLDFFAAITYHRTLYGRWYRDNGHVHKCTEEWFRVILRDNVFVDEQLCHTSTNRWSRSHLQNTPWFSFRRVNNTTILVPNCPRSERSKFIIHVEEQLPFLDSAIVKERVGANYKGLYDEKHDIVRKYEWGEKRGDPEEICLAQFV